MSCRSKQGRGVMMNGTGHRRGHRVVFPEADDPRVAEAIGRLRADGTVHPVLVPDGAPDQAEVDLLCRRRPGLKPAFARRLLSKPLYRAAAMVATGRAEAMVAGAASPTRRVIEAATMVIGLADRVEIPSSFFLMRLADGREVIFADCAVNAMPDAAGLAAIARASGHSARALLGDARIALLSFASGSSGAGPSVGTVSKAVEILSDAGIKAVGPVQADAALNPDIAATKGVGDGMANVLVFPSLDAGNIAYKLLQELGGAQAIGPVLQGFRRPVCDLSRGARVDDIVQATLVSLRLGAGPSV